MSDGAIRLLGVFIGMFFMGAGAAAAFVFVSSYDWTGPLNPRILLVFLAAVLFFFGKGFLEAAVKDR